jgi:UDP-2,3-diacylglucosamine hydrolase
MKTLFISDLHLSEESGDARKYFLDFLQEKTQEAEALYILGDFFEVWCGDDDHAEWIAEVINSIKNLKIKVYFMQGNRDFLLGKIFAEKCGAILLEDPTVIDLYGVPTLLTHGDSLCTEDQAYQRWRKFSHNRLIQKIFLSLPLSWRQKIANHLRKKSKDYVKALSSEIMDVTLKSVDEIAQKYQVTQLIHGHTHRPAVHKRGSYTRFVLPDWHAKGGMLVTKFNEPPQLVLFE